MKLLCAAVLLMAVSAAAFPEPDVTELKINVEVGSRLPSCQLAEHACISEASRRTHSRLCHTQHKPKDCSRQAKIGDTIKVHYSVCAHTRQTLSLIMPACANCHLIIYLLGITLVTSMHLFHTGVPDRRCAACP